ncbi:MULTISPECIES: beta-ketoacyl synthase N-terminal-like domain-containing protein [unclassified Nocardia]|uniref:beta-ketoacyl synthase N-terminal-like domain-containing protein n=1 Tax=unclassified Nocardia TaxID=2637762 RepID=UPI001CE431F1|nr:MULTISPECIES: beta-ketoacyl synthase N-terminal-like domain-containing protein [unclassified Nocardia]
MQPVAVIGMSCRFAGAADSPEALWRMLIDEVDAVGAPPPGRGTQPGAYLPDVAGFDAEFFGITPREATEMDPQQRLALELAWEALEDAGIRPGAAPDTAVFFANKFNDYRALKIARGVPPNPFTSTGDVEGVIANRISYFLGFDGPSTTVNASCAGSLVAVHLACQALRAGESSLALAGGVQLNLISETTDGLARLGVLSPRGRSHTFDATADGYARGEGGAVVVLKLLADALRDGDRIYCTLLGSATNNNGHHHTMPASSSTGQEQLLRRACAAAGVDPARVDYLEAHGTGTAVGDRAEIVALGAVYGVGREADSPLIIGSVKANIGHTEAAAGLAGLVKAALALWHRRIPRSLHFDRAASDLGALGLRVADTALAWPETGRPARAAVSAFGFGGSNAHVVLEQAPVGADGRSGSLGERIDGRTESADSGVGQHARCEGPTGRTGDLSEEIDDRAASADSGAVQHARSEGAAGQTGGLGEWIAGGAASAGGELVQHADGAAAHRTSPLGSADRLLVVSARTEAALRAQVRRLHEYLADRPDIPLDDIAHTLCTRTPFAQRLSFVADSTAAFVQLLGEQLAADATEPGDAELAPLAAAALRPGSVSRRDVLAAVGALFRRGIEPDWAAVNPEGRVVSLPTYPFQRQRYWATDALDSVADEPVSTAAAERIRIGSSSPPAGSVDIVDERALRDLVAAELAAVIGVQAAAIDRRQNFDRLGVGSVHAVELSGRLSAELDTTVPAAIIWGCPTVELLAAELARRLLATPADQTVTKPLPGTATDPTGSGSAAAEPAPRTTVEPAEEDPLSIEELRTLGRELLG